MTIRTQSRLIRPGRFLTRTNKEQARFDHILQTLVKLFNRGSAAIPGERALPGFENRLKPDSYREGL